MVCFLSFGFNLSIFWISTAHELKAHFVMPSVVTSHKWDLTIQIGQVLQFCVLSISANFWEFWCFNWPQGSNVSSNHGKTVQNISGIKYYCFHQFLKHTFKRNKVIAPRIPKICVPMESASPSACSLLAEVSHDETNLNKRRATSAGFRRVSYHACPSVSLTSIDVFVMCDTTQRTGLNLGASASSHWIWARAQILNGPIRVEDGKTLWAAVVLDPITSLWGKPKRRISRQIFRSLRVFRPAKHT